MYKDKINWGEGFEPEGPKYRPLDTSQKIIKGYK
jgi:hypothetical protein